MSMSAASTRRAYPVRVPPLGVATLHCYILRTLWEWLIGALAAVSACARHSALKTAAVVHCHATPRRVTNKDEIARWGNMRL